ncbi:unnamed protein product [Aphanomyces euteiches]
MSATRVAETPSENATKKAKLDFESLYQNSLQLTRGMEQLPSLQRSLEQLHAVTSSKTLASTAPPAATNKAQFLLAGRGFDAEKLSRELKQSELKASFEPKDPLGDCDLEGFLRHHHEMIVVTAIEEAMAATTRSAQQSALNSLNNEFQASKTKLMQDLQGRTTPLAYRRSEPSIALSTPSVDRPTPLGAPHTTEASSMTESMKVYAAAIRAYFQAKQRSIADFNLLQEYQKAAQSLVIASSTDSVEQETLCCWELIGHMTQHRSPSPTAAALFQQQDATFTSALSAGARVFFEKRYHLFIETKIDQLKIPRGGVPGLRALVQTYVRQVIREPSNVWPEIYYLMRCGGLKDALALAEDHVGHGGRAKLARDALRHFISSGAALATANASLQASLASHFDQLTAVGLSDAQTTNRFELAVINLLCGRDALYRNAGVVENIEDFLWQVLWCSRQEAAEEVASKVLRLVQPSEFNHTTIAGVFEYVRLLLVCQQFDSAIESLAAKGYVVEAVHLAIGLHHHGLYRRDTDAMFTRLLRQYIHAFQRTDPSEAAMYIACHHDADTVRSMSCELLLDTGAFNVLAGSTSAADASRIPGALDLYLLRQEVREIVFLASQKAETLGRPLDALQLLTIVGDVESAMLLLNAQLVQTLASPDRMTWLNHARSFADTWLRASWALDIALQARNAALAFQTLMNIGLFLELLDAKKYTEGIAFVEALVLLPAPGGEQAAVDRFMTMDQGVQQNIHLVLVGYMECLVWETERIKASVSAIDTQRHLCKQLQDKARAVVSFSGMIKIRLPLGVNERLNQLEIRIM